MLKVRVLRLGGRLGEARERPLVWKVSDIRVLYTPVHERLSIAIIVCVLQHLEFFMPIFVTFT